MDQVTVNRTSFTVICTYFFFDGKIYVILNKLQKLTTEDYNSEGTASMVIKTLCETLGFTKSKLSNVLKHLVYFRTALLSKNRSNFCQLAICKIFSFVLSKKPAVRKICSNPSQKKLYPNYITKIFFQKD